VAIILAFHLMDWGAEILAEKVDNLTFMLPFVAFLIIFLVVILTIRGVAYMVKKTLDLTILGSLDSVAGAILGIFKTGFALSLILWVANSFEFKFSEPWMNESVFYPFIQPMAPLTINFVDGYTPIVKQTIASIQELVNTASNVIVY
jgi:membrane protein required for colicin V production